MNSTQACDLKTSFNIANNAPLPRFLLAFSNFSPFSATCVCFRARGPCSLDRECLWPREGAAAVCAVCGCGIARCKWPSRCTCTRWFAVLHTSSHYLYHHAIFNDVFFGRTVRDLTIIETKQTSKLMHSIFTAVYTEIDLTNIPQV